MRKSATSEPRCGEADISRTDESKVAVRAAESGSPAGETRGMRSQVTRWRPIKYRPAPPIEASPDDKPGFSLADGKLTLPAVAGNPGAAYFTLTNKGAAASLAAIYIEGGQKAEMHETSGGSMSLIASVSIKAGETVKFAPGGKHVMVFGMIFNSRVM